MAFVLLFAALAVGTLTAFVASRPTDFRVTRMATIPAPPEAVFAEVNNLHRWEAWSPWAKLDPKATNNYSGALNGLGASMHWKGAKVGEGRMTIIESRPAKLVRLRLEFTKPFVAINGAEFSFQPQADGTLVTWRMTGRRNFMFKAVNLLMNCDKMCGDMFEKGLASLRAVVLDEPVAAPRQALV